ncbi:ornithine cyclodeaminase [Hydrogenophaga sp.]|uniref:ornithine cyclodeaminase n=1 Tax=Hydrogenophaga sp. TaxID=1904254 RepID=UPI0035ADCF6E
MKTTVHNPDLARFVEAGTLYLSAPDAADLVRRHGVAPCIEAIAANIRADFLRWADFDKTARVAAHSDVGVIELMPVADAQRYSFKYVNGHPGNTRLGLSTVMAFGVLADVDTGAPLFLSELTLTTALRTAAMSALAAKVLARPDSRVMALIGNGAQSEFQALAFAHMVGITDLRLYDIDPAASAKLVANLQGSGLRVTVCASTAEAVRGADIVTTVTADKRNALILTPEMIEPGVHLNAVGGDCPGKTELHGDILEAAKVFVEYEPQSRIEGEIQHKTADFAVTEFWQVLRGERSGRDHAGQVTVFDSVGFALEDFSALRFMHDTAVRLAMGERIALVPVLSDPKNLFGSLRAAPSGLTCPRVLPVVDAPAPDRCGALRV